MCPRTDSDPLSQYCTTHTRVAGPLAGCLTRNSTHRRPALTSLRTAHGAASRRTLFGVRVHLVPRSDLEFSRGPRKLTTVVAAFRTTLHALYRLCERLLSGFRAKRLSAGWRRCVSGICAASARLAPGHGALCTRIHAHSCDPIRALALWPTRLARGLCCRGGRRPTSGWQRWQAPPAARDTLSVGSPGRKAQACPT